MFVTENIGPVELLSQILCGYSVDESETHKLARYRHNNDLCPFFRDRIDNVFTTYQKHSIGVYDIQGFSDKGVDVVVKIMTEDEDIKVALQIKSHKEINDYKEGRDPNLISKIRNQYTQAIQEANVNFFYLVLCGDAVAHRDSIRTITSAFHNYRNFKLINPAMALGFIQMTNNELDAHITQILCARDYVLLEAKKSVKDFPAAALSVVTHLLFRALSGDSRLTHQEYETIIQDNYEGSPDGDEYANIMEILKDGLIEEMDAMNYRIVPDAYPEICAVYYDQLARIGGRADSIERTALLIRNSA